MQKRTSPSFVKDNKEVHRIMAHHDMTKKLEKVLQEKQRVGFINLKSFVKAETISTTLELYQFAIMTVHTLFLTLTTMII